jgi:phosphoglycolate phosphatase
VQAVDLIIFDLDGTLVDSKHDIASCVNMTLTKFGINPLAVEVIARHVGTGIRPLLSEVAQQNTSIGLPALLGEFERCYEQQLAVQTRPYPGILGVLEHFSSKKLVVLTNKMQRFGDKLIKELDLTKFFEAIYGREAFPKHKPDPLPVVEICRNHKTEPLKTVIVGDTEIDMIAGKRAGVFTCAALFGYGDRTALLTTKPDFEIHSPVELVKIFH